MNAPRANARNPLWQRASKAAAFLAAVLVTLAALALAWIGYSGRQEWNQVKKELLAKGEKLSYADIVGPPVPDEQNFFADPMWQELFDYVERPDGKGVLTSEVRTPSGERQSDLLTAVDTAAGRKSIPLIARSNWGNPGAYLDNLAAKMREENLPGADEPASSSAQTILNVLKKVEPQWNAVAASAERPFAQPPVPRSGFATPLDHLTVLSKGAQFLGLRARVELLTDDSQAAFRDARLLFRIADLMQGEPLIISELVRISVLWNACATIKRGIDLHAWDDGQLSEFQRIVEEQDALAAAALALRGERALYNQVMETAAESGSILKALGAKLADVGEGTLPLPATIYDRFYIPFFRGGDQAAYNLFLQQQIDRLSVADAPPPAQSSDGDTDLQHRLRHPMTLQARRFVPGFGLRAVQSQTMLDQTAIGIALERHRLEHGAYPADLSALVPQFLTGIPPDRFDRQAMRYRIGDDGRILVWSIGPNQIDDNGQAEGQNRNSGDWVWGR
jgi:hypothetical protein